MNTNFTKEYCVQDKFLGTQKMQIFLNEVHIFLEFLNPVQKLIKTILRSTKEIVKIYARIAIWNIFKIHIIVIEVESDGEIGNIKKYW